MLGVLSLVLATLQDPVSAQDVQDSTVTSTWKDLLRFETADGAHRLRLPHLKQGQGPLSSKAYFSYSLRKPPIYVLKISC